MTIYAKRRGRSFLSDYLQDVIDDSSARYNNADNSKIHELSFIYVDEDGSEHELNFRINVKPIDSDKEFVNISFEYPDPEDPLNGKLQVANNRFKAVSNTQEDIVKRCQQFLEEVFDVDSIENLPENITASETIEAGVIGDTIKQVTDSLGTKATGFFTKFFQDLFKENRHIEVDSKKKKDGVLIYTMKGVLEDNDGNPQVEFPASISIAPIDGDKTKVTVNYQLPHPDDLNQYIQHEDDSIKNSKDLVEKHFWKFFDEDYEDEDKMKAFVDKFALNPDSFTKEIEETEEEQDIQLEGQPTDEATASVDIENNEKTEVESMKKPIDPKKNMNICLSKEKVEGGYEICLHSIMASYDATTALADLATIVNNDEFAESIPYGDKYSYEVYVNDDSIDVEPVTSYDQDELYRMNREAAYNIILDAAYTLYLDNEFMGFQAAGPQMSTIQNYVMNYSWRAHELIESVSHMILEEHFTLENPVKRIKKFDETLLTPEVPCFWKDYLIKIQGDIQTLINVLDLYSCNFSDDKRSQMEGWIRNWTHEIDYVLKRGELDFG